MYRIGEREIEAVAKVIGERRLFRYGKGSACERFERRYARYLGVEYCMMNASGTAALAAALVGVGLGPGDEVLVPACTYIATPIAVLTAGAIPVIVDIDESITLSPAAVRAAIGPRTRGIVPVHMWGLPCDMQALSALAAEAGLVVVEDACQAIGGSFQGRKLGSIGQAGAYSFNYYKNMTCGEGGATVTSDADVFDRIRCMVDCCRFYWHGREDAPPLFVSCGARASEIEGAILSVQLDRLDPVIRRLRRQKLRLLRETADVGLQPVRANDPDGECASHLMYLLPTAEQAQRFAALAGTGIAARTGRHVYTEWDPIFAHAGGPHPAMNPFRMPENRDCRMDYRRDMCKASMDILERTVMLGLDPEARRPAVSTLVRRLRRAAKTVL